MAVQEEFNPSFWLAVAGLAWSAANTLYTRLSSGRRDLEGRIIRAEAGAKDDKERLEKDLNGLGHRLTQVETTVAKGPSHGHLAEIHEKINEVTRMVERLNGSNESNTDLLKAIHRHIIETGRNNGKS